MVSLYDDTKGCLKTFKLVDINRPVGIANLQLLQFNNDELMNVDGTEVCFQNIYDSDDSISQDILKGNS